MNTLEELQSKRSRLQKRYKRLIEDAYNWRQTDSALSDISEFKAIRLLDKLNRLRFLDGDPLNFGSQ